MSQNNIDRVQDVWFENLKWIIKTPYDEIIKESSAIEPKWKKTLTDKCFGAFEDENAIHFHNFYVVSPKYIVILVNCLYMWDLIKTVGLRKSWSGGELHANSVVIYTKKSMRGAEDFTPTDVFKYKRIVVPKEKVYLGNSIILGGGT
ncbi:hypothetical protein BCR41DRAFT_399686 [Lobosporangium transversale]|uniref:Uncharacterized protein n=1 Tax=Lobosporangium transversale TaxID=64571 RepID=A0A1Y2GD76_9FUNG|nr:hypothetical protein BCR41DRAFT_399686 [Lobosporangium transversale]ORZ07537.1 hypothetical protein BCR41DRAFT_399686 [Lobosporangium transversale]|eukprot:XP_021878044.1 hypothetical protein BCR41DRAFT_399686 [Lobosporangium transversale]